MTAQRKGFDATIAITFLGFVALGLAEPLLGIAWPSIREEFNLPLDAIGWVLVASTAGFLLTSFNSGPIIRRLGTRRTLLLAFLLRGVILCGIMLAPSWPVIVILGFFSGMGGGGIDASINTYVATYHNNRLMNWVHACFGVGATLGPLMMSELIDAGHSWRLGYLLVGIVQLTLAGLIFAARVYWNPIEAPQAAGDASREQAASSLQTLRLPVAWLGIATFAVYAGLEFTAGNWTYTLFTESRGIAEKTAGRWVSIYWGSFTVGRILFGMVADRWSIVTSVRGLLAGMLVGAALLWLNPSDLVSFTGLALLGFALAPIYAILITGTSIRLGPQHAANAIGFQVSAAGIGVAIVPSVAGILAENIGLETIAPYTFALAVLTLVGHEALVYVSARRLPMATAQTPVA